MLQEYVSGERDETAIGPLIAHCRICEDCRRILELHRDLIGMASAAPDPGEAGIDDLQASVLAEVARRERRERGMARSSLRATSWGFPARWLPRVAAAFAGAVVLFATGLYAGLALHGPDVVQGNGSIATRLIAAIEADAVSNRVLDDVEDSRFTYSNVSFRPLEGGRVALDFDVTTHVQLVEPVRSEIVGDVLVHSLLNPSTTGARLKAMSLASGAMEPKVREALIFAMRHDDNLAVRLKALALLSDRMGEAGVEAAMLDILREDESVQVRLLALECLAANRVDPELLRARIRESGQPGDEALMVRLSEYDTQI